MTSDRPMRADARRNYERLLAAAAEVFAKEGTNAALDDVARYAGIGNATLYRHFPTRQDLVEALLTDRYDDLRATAERLLADRDPRAALITWLRSFITHMTTYRGLAASVMTVLRDPETELSASCKGMQAAAATLLAHAQESAVIRPDLTVDELLRLTNGVAIAAEGNPDETARLLRLLTEGLYHGCDSA
ncbi:TetR/AcrR family transcriptional regulator [Pseudofrankia inefficax]|uniref:Regulatory protein TetR n=1 Tax=Pseudofrankia inefficax (strain DSM 45817 / CECT 9037 / DDB 130130 / EuI1c) TaxID=298654 RepID=E3IXN7_PSEI1|nr:TetR/AcrR family transcriptional regulator [Pseudofrankia inefficax]ADP80196.1 regulatory protein TetR [Pseudofrankia inefficax]